MVNNVLVHSWCVWGGVRVIVAGYSENFTAVMSFIGAVYPSASEDLD